MKYYLKKRTIKLWMLNICSTKKGQWNHEAKDRKGVVDKKKKRAVAHWTQVYCIAKLPGSVAWVNCLWSSASEVPRPALKLERSMVMFNCKIVKRSRHEDVSLTYTYTNKKRKFNKAEKKGERLKGDKKWGDKKLMAWPTYYLVQEANSMFGVITASTIV